MEYVLQMQVLTSTGKKVTLAIKDVMEEVTGAQVKAIYAALKPIWATSGDVVELLSAKVVVTTTTDYMA